MGKDKPEDHKANRLTVGQTANVELDEVGRKHHGHDFCKSVGASSKSGPICKSGGPVRHGEVLKGKVVSVELRCKSSSLQCIVRGIYQRQIRERDWRIIDLFL